VGSGGAGAGAGVGGSAGSTGAGDGFGAGAGTGPDGAGVEGGLVGAAGLVPFARLSFVEAASSSASRSRFACAASRAA